IPGSDVLALTSEARFPKRPDLLRPLDGFDTCEAGASGDSGILMAGCLGYPGGFGSRIPALLTPTNSGIYTLFIAARDQGQLWFNASPNPGGATMRAYVTAPTDYREWTRSLSQQSGPLQLVAGQQYYLEARQKAGGFSPFQPVWLDAHLEVAWAGPGLT